LEEDGRNTTFQPSTTFTSFLRPTSTHWPPNSATKCNFNTINQPISPSTASNPTPSPQPFPDTFWQLESTETSHSNSSTEPFYITQPTKPNEPKTPNPSFSGQPGKEKTLKKTESRRKTRRRAVRYKKNIKKQKEIPICQNLYHIQPRCVHNYGFCADANASLQTNSNNAIKNSDCYLPPRIKNLTYHDLCSINQPPPGVGQLLGLNLKYCLSSNTLKNNIPHTVQKKAYSIRTKYQLQQLGHTENSHYIKQIYLRNKNWNPEPAPPVIEENITNFDKKLKLNKMP